MKLTITQPAVHWFKKEMELIEGDSIRLFARLGGCSTVQTGYSIGIAKESPFEPGSSVEVDGITFFVEEKDLWYFNGYDLSIKFRRKYDDITYDYTKQ
ncbi:HesB/YadR/YfhF family protein [Pseudalkalibacillus decolorationis]|uniref:HesB/YadR/YfhF family protein n=1 Tax=Pseudalkalibacillus decolorationis TaxID=163879 RepID=UPI002148AAD4|nr:HesB/YadR/YfhF family protein [Pseudalkalibacillus decolorationis]